MTDAQQLLTLAGGVVLLVGAVAGWVRWARPKYRKVRSTGTAIVATLVGTEEIRHKITGEVIVPASPSVGVQVAELTTAVTKLTEHQAQTERLEGRVDTLETEVGDLKGDVKVLKDAVAERIAAHGDSEAGWNAMAAAHRATPDDDNG